MTFARLLAKSVSQNGRVPEGATLVGHTALTSRIALLLGDHFGVQYIRSLGLDAERFAPLLKLALPRAGLLHDLGKANDHFQQMIRDVGKGYSHKQAWRHEQLSAWLPLRFSDLESWLFGGCEPSLRDTVLAAVAGHHLRLEDGNSFGETQRGELISPQVQVLTGHRDFTEALHRAGEALGLHHPPEHADVSLDPLSQDDVRTPLRAWARQAASWLARADEGEQRFVATVKALLVAADVGASALWRSTQLDPVEWAGRALSHTCKQAALEQVVTERLTGQGGRKLEPRTFQSCVAASETRVTFVRAGCGSGKTAAAYMWAARRAADRKLFFCYPTTGTASQGFTDYLPSGAVEWALVHSRAAVDLEDMLTNGPADEQDGLDEALRLGALSAWGAPVTVCTVDTVLGLLQNNRTGLFIFPAIANGTFVFDEIHQYDDRLFGCLLRFLQIFAGVPVLLMTACLPGPRLDALKDTMAALGEEITLVDGPADLEELKRYRLERADTETAWEHVRATVSQGAKVLWVTNQVERAVTFAQDAESQGLPVVPFHSRFRYGDRVLRQRELIEAFRGDRGVVAITTQVCEVSLDISADLLVSDLAPAAALIQRLGRLNRRAGPDEASHPSPALIIEPRSEKPYEKGEMLNGRRWLDLVGGSSVSQADLAKAFEELLKDVPPPRAGGSAAWLDDGILAAPAPLREEGYTIPVVREEDLRRLTRPRSSEIARIVIPMPLFGVARELGSWRRAGKALVAPEGRLA
jgi:CRISPR-associated endonuclease/helicase Cas3